MEYKKFNDKGEAIRYRDSQREKGLASSYFNYGKDRHMIKTTDTTDERRPGWTQQWLSRLAWDLADDIESLNKIKELIADPDLYADIEGMTFVAKYLNKNRWFKTPDDVIGFFDYLDEKTVTKIKEYIDESLADYDGEWNDLEN